MGKEKYLKRIMALFGKSHVVKFSSIERIVRQRRGQYTKQVIRNLIKQGKIRPLTKGLYTTRNDASLVIYGFQPAYLGLQDALSFHNLWEQETIPVIITSRKVRPGIRKALEINVLVRRINKKYLFGYNYYPESGIYLPYSDIEKTFIDMAYFKQPLGRAVLNNILKKTDFKKINKYLRVYPKKIRNRILLRIHPKRLR